MEIDEINLKGLRRYSTGKILFFQIQGPEFHTPEQKHKHTT